ncbi:PAS domain S-box protein [Heyndrickxia acidicola]|uniref:histidine kinase n=1 Tax=Heyndrickxia acidicola TaxID=209389 RepID=A0ABU6MFC3_9BACI|nr:PAS domain S-box protein [Heyndrickxia acidicola]MED1203366.1 PAS domain S-box protein [Heyndrickxia acidicola]
MEGNHAGNKLAGTRTGKRIIHAAECRSPIGVEQADRACYLLDRNWRFTFVNQIAEDLLRRKQQDLIGEMIWDEFPNAFRSTFYFEYHKVMGQKIKVQFQEYYFPLDKWFEVNASPYKEGIKVEFWDISNDKNKLPLGFFKNQNLFEQHPDALYLIDKNGRYLSVNNGFEKHTGYSKNEAQEMSISSLAAQEDWPKVRYHFSEALKGNAQSYEVPILTKQKEKRYMSITNAPIIENDEVVWIFGIAKDITERICKQKKIREQKELYQLLMRNSQDIISSCTPEGICTYISPAVERLLGYKPAEIIDTLIFNYYHPEDIVYLHWGKRDVDVAKVRIRNKRGVYIWIELSIKAIRNQDGRIEKVMGIGRDISARLQSEAMILKSEKLAMAGQLAAGVAHEIRNPLTAVKGFLQIMQAGNPLKREYLDVMYSEIERIEGIISELLLLAKPNCTTFSHKNIHGILSQVTRLMETEALKEKVLITKLFSEEDFIIHCEENQIKQVFINLIKNSIEAMPSGGVIKIETKRKGSEAVIVLSDTGQGIPQELLPQIGQLFFTSKEKGTGLGLAVSYNIIENHQGEIEIESILNKGTTFTITLPLIE